MASKSHTPHPRHRTGGVMRFVHFVLALTFMTLLVTAGRSTTPASSRSDRRFSAAAKTMRLVASIGRRHHDGVHAHRVPPGSSY